MAAQRALATTEKETVAQVLRSSVFTGDVAKGIVWAHNSHLGQHFILSWPHLASPCPCPH
jgi:erythromycin esterase-like protein